MASSLSSDIVNLDFDGVMDAIDNCTNVANVEQLDTDGDELGTACDPDLDNTGVVNLLDVGVFISAFGATGENAADFNGDQVVNFLDFAIFPGYTFKAPGPGANGDQ